MNHIKIQAKVCCHAAAILKAGYAPSRSIALKKAWKIAKIAAGNPTLITFAKQETGEIRTSTALITGALDSVSRGFVRFVEIVDGRSQWRSFRIDHLIID